VCAAILSGLSYSSAEKHQHVQVLVFTVRLVMECFCLWYGQIIFSAVRKSLC